MSTSGGFMMIQLCIRRIDIAVAGFSDAQAKIDVIKGHLQGFVEAAHLFEDLFSHDQTGRCDGAKRLNEARACKIAILVTLEVSMRMSCDTSYPEEDAGMLHGSECNQTISEM